MSALVDFVTTSFASKDAGATEVIGRVRTWLAKLLLAVRRQNDAEIKERLAAPPLDELSVLPDRVRSSQRDAATDVAARLQTLVAEGAPAVDELAAIDAVLAKLARRFTIERALLQTGKAVLLAIPAIGGYFAAVYFRFNAGLYPSTQAVLWPLTAYTADASGGALTLRPEYEKRFFDSFSRYYFRRDGREEFERMFLQRRGDQAIELKFVLTNAQKAGSQMISTIEVDATPSLQPFAWDRVDVTPKLVAKIDGSTLMLEDVGIGPAVDLQWTVDAGALRLSEGTSEAVFHGTETITTAVTTGSIESIAASGDTLDRPLFRETPDPSAIPCADKFYERIDSVARLGKLTKLVRGGEADVAYRYASLRGDSFAEKTRLPLPDDRVFFVRNRQLLDHVPCDEALPPVGYRPIPDGLAPDTIPQVIDALDAQPRSIKGVDVVTSRIDLPLATAVDGEHVAAMKTPDEILNAGGYLIVYVRLVAPKSGALDLALNVNGREVRRMTIPVLAPDELTFNASDLEGAKQRFRAAKR